MIRGSNSYFDARIIRRVRKGEGITQRELARRIGSSQQTISWIERNKLEPNKRILQAIAEALGLDLDDFYTDVEPPVSPKAPTSIGEAVQQARLAAGIDQATLASRVGSRSLFSISHIETGFRRPSRKMARAIALALGLAPETLWKFLPIAPELDVNLPPKSIGEAIRKARMKKGITRHQLCKATGVSVSVVGNAETHLNCPQNDSLVRLATYLGEDVEAFLRLARLAKVERRAARAAPVAQDRIARQRAPVLLGQRQAVPVACPYCREQADVLPEHNDNDGNGVSRNHRKIIDLLSSEDLTRREVSERLGVSVGVVSYACQKYGLKFVREPSKSRFPKLRDRNWLYRKVAIEGLTPLELADLLGCSQQYVRQKVEEYGIWRAGESGPVDPTKLASWPTL